MTAPHETGTLQHIDPNELQVERNVRKHVELDRGFLSSIKQRGVLQPPTAWWDDVAGAYQVLDGQRRVIAARKAEHATIPVVIVDAIAAEEQRIVDQLAANEHRQQLADVDKVAAYGDLALFGWSSDKIQRRTNLPEELIQTGIRISRSKTAAAVVQKHPTLGLEQAAVFAEFEDDADAIATLQEQVTRDPAQILHAASRIRNDRAERAEKASIAEELTAKGIDMVDADSFEIVDKRGWRLDDTYPTAARRTHITLDHALGSGATVVARLWRQYKGPQQYAWEPSFYVLDGAKHGFFAPDYLTKKVDSLTDEERELEKAARRVARENTKAWKAATDVRVEFIRGLYRRRDLPVGWSLFTLEQSLNLIHQSYQSTWKSIGAILGIEDLTSAWASLPAVKEYIAERPQNASQIMFGIALGTFEGQQDFESKGWLSERGRLVAYLELLQSWGYTLSEIEQHVVNGTVPV